MMLHILIWALIVLMWVTFLVYVAWSWLKRSGRI